MSDTILLVYPPIASVLRPSIGVSSLKSVLGNEGISARNIYINIDYAEAIGVEFNEYLSEQTPVPLLVGEWIFSGLLRRFSPKEEETYYSLLKQCFPLELIEKITAVRKKSDEFISSAAERLVANKPVLIGFSTTFQQNCSSLAIAAKIRKLNPAIKICFGGANCEGQMGETLLEKFPQIDYVFSGESEETFLAFLKNFFAKKKTRRDGRSIKGKQIEHLDLLPVPDYNEYFRAIQHTSFSRRVNPAILFETSRGCWWGHRKHCTFCGLNGDSIRYRKKSPGKIATEIDILLKEWKVPRFMAVDNIIDGPNILKAFQLRKEREKANFFWEVRANLSKSKLEELRKNGTIWMQAGIESLSNSILKAINKGTTCIQNIYFLKTCGELGITVSWNILAGFPGEDNREYRQMAALFPKLEHIEPPNSCSPFTICRFSPYYERQEEFALHHVQPYDTYGQVYGFSKEAAMGIAYFFINKSPKDDKKEYLIPIKKAISGWKERWQGERPILTLQRTDKGGIIHDTRIYSTHESRSLNMIEAGILDFFQSPKKIKDGEKFHASIATSDVYRRLVGSLIQNGYLVESEEYALSLVMENPLPYISTDNENSVLGWLDERPEGI